MERMIRVVLFVALAAVGLDRAHFQRQFDALKPPHRANAIEELLAYYTLPPQPEPPYPPPPPPLSEPP
jgi:hypothetical protein